MRRKSADSRNRNTPIVAFSGLSSAQVYDCGINAFMHKPFSLVC